MLYKHGIIVLDLKEEIMKSPIELINPDHKKDIEDGICNTFYGCGKSINLQTEFTDELSVKEYAISGMCQNCQDGIFGEE